MGVFYIDESIHDRGGFILAAIVYSETDLSPLIFAEVADSGLEPGKDEFKSSSKMSENGKQQELRGRLKELIKHVKIGITVIPIADRKSLGDEVLKCLNKIIHRNNLTMMCHQVFFDEEIYFIESAQIRKKLRLDACCDFHFNQDSRRVGGLQMADLVAHTLSIMLLEDMGLVTKTVKAGENTGYDHEEDIEIGFEMWASLRYHFFTQDNIKLDEPDQTRAFTLEVGRYAVHVSKTCTPSLQDAVTWCFGKCYVGCIH